MLLAVMLLVILMVIGLALEAPRIGQQIKREKEEELIHRGNEYKNAIRRFFRKFGNYPVSIEQLESSNNMRFLRKRFVDPFTGKADWHLLRPGEVQLNTINGGMIGAPGQPSGGPIGAGSQSMGSSTFGQPGNSSSTATPSPTPQPTGDQNSSAATSDAGTGGLTPANNMPGASGNSPVIGGGQIMGVSSTRKLQSIKVFNGKDHYNDWQFVYDPRLEAVTTNPALGNPGVAPVGGTTPGTNLQPTPSPPMNNR